MVHATLVGRLFTRGFMRAYGPRACCSLFVIQKILAVEPQQDGNLDYRAALQEGDAIRSGNFHHWRSLLEGDPFRLAIEAQKRAEQADTPWVFNDPDQVARKEFWRFLEEEDEALTRDPSLKPKQEYMSPLFLDYELIKVEPGRRVYEWNYPWDMGPRTGRHYVMVLSRPYLVSFYARDPKKVAWIVVDMVELGDEECGAARRC